jgi:hypothetical protein
MGILKSHGGPRQTQCNSPDGRRGTEEDIQLAVENVHKQEFRLSQMNDCGTVIFDDDRPTVHLDTLGMQWNAELDEQEQQLHHLSSEEIQQTCSRTIELASASAGTGAAPGAGEAAAPGAGEAAGPGAGEAASAGSRSRGRSSSMSRFVQVDGQRHRRWKLKKRADRPTHTVGVLVQNESRTGCRSRDHAAYGDCNKLRLRQRQDRRCVTVSQLHQLALSHLHPPDLPRCSSWSIDTRRRQ